MMKKYKIIYNKKENQIVITFFSENEYNKAVDGLLYGEFTDSNDNMVSCYNHFNVKENDDDLTIHIGQNLTAALNYLKFKKIIRAKDVSNILNAISMKDVPSSNKNMQKLLKIKPTSDKVDLDSFTNELNDLLDKYNSLFGSSNVAMNAIETNYGNVDFSDVAKNIYLKK